MARKEQIKIGEEYGYLTIISEPFKDKYFYKNKSSSRWFVKYKCRCGSVGNISICYIGHTMSCGCLKVEKCIESAKHGYTNTKIYKIWSGMKSRCNYNKNENFKYYGGKGIKVCQEWEDSFEAFLKWSMENGYVPGLSIERLDSTKNYEPNNCKWIELSKQQNNTSRSLMIFAWGETKSLSDWCRDVRCSLNYNTAICRIKDFRIKKRKLKFKNMEELLSTPPIKIKK